MHSENALPTAPLPHGTQHDDAHEEAERKWREGRIVDVQVKIWDAEKRAGVADVLTEKDPPRVFLVEELFANSGLTPQPGDILRGLLHSHTFGGHWLLDSADSVEHSSLTQRTPEEEEEALHKQRKEARRMEQLVNGETYVGKVVRWRDDEAAGYIKVQSLKAKVYFPQSSFVFRDKRPEKHQRVSFVAGRRGDQWVATRVIPQGYTIGFADQPTEQTSGTLMSGSFSEVVLAIAFVCLHLSAVAFLSLPVAAAYLLLSCLLLWLYRFDKRTAQASGRTSVPDTILHLLSLIGGWPGGLMAQLRYHHHTANIRFVRIFWFTVAANVVWTYIFLVYLLNRPELAFLKN